MPARRRRITSLYWDRREFERYCRVHDPHRANFNKINSTYTNASAVNHESNIKASLSESNLAPVRGQLRVPPVTRETSPKLISFLQEFANVDSSSRVAAY